MNPITFSCEATLLLAPEDIARQILDLTKWPDFHGYGPIPGIKGAEFDVQTPSIVGSRIRVTNEDGSSHIEEIVEWEPDHRLRLEMKEFSAPLSRLAKGFEETWEFKRIGNATHVTRSFRLHAESVLARLLLWMISFFFMRAIVRHLREMKELLAPRKFPNRVSPSEKGINAVDFLTPDQQNMIATLAKDAITCHERLKNEPQSAAFWKRTTVKSIFAFHEGLCSILRDIARRRHQESKFTLDKGELDVLDDTEFELENTGKVGTRTRKDKTLNLIAFTIRVILKGFGISDDDIGKRVFGIQGWNDLRTSMAVRDRLTHPKTAESLLVTDDEIEKCRSSMGWMYQCIDLATRANLRQAGVPEDRIQEVSKGILAALPDVTI